jgi:type IV secretory pathway VirB10-like protein
MSDDRNFRIDIHLYWPSGLWDRTLRLTRRFATVKGWITIALLVIGIILLSLLLARGPTPTPSPPSPDPGPPSAVVRPEPPVKPDPPRPDEAPPPAARPDDTPLSKAIRDYHRRFPAVVPKTLWELADKLDNREIKDKLAAVTFYKRNGVALVQALDGVFSPGIDPNNSDPKGVITNPAAISGPLRQTAKALGYKPPAQADSGPQSFDQESP